jgi:hypothetical protein
LNWKIYTRAVPVEGGVAIRWFWRKPVVEGRTESARGFTTRAECEEDAKLHGYPAAGPSAAEDRPTSHE